MMAACSKLTNLYHIVDGLEIVLWHQVIYVILDTIDFHVVYVTKVPQQLPMHSMYKV